MTNPPKPRLPDDDDDPNEVPTLIARRPALPPSAADPGESPPQPPEPDPKP